MKKIKILLCIAIIIICIQVTYSRFITQFPTGTISATTGKAIVDLDYVGIESSDYMDSVPSLLDSKGTITYSFNVKNYITTDVGSTTISNVDLQAFIYVVFYDNSWNVISNLNCALTNDLNEAVSKTTMVTSSTLTINGESITLPIGTIKFSPSETFPKESQVTNTYHLSIQSNIDSLPTSEIVANMKIYCSAEQPV